MFLRAGFNLRHRVIAYAKVASRGIWRARLIVFAHGGDLAWYCPGQWLNWHMGHVVGFIGYAHTSIALNEFPCSPWPRREPAP